MNKKEIIDNTVKIIKILPNVKLNQLIKELEYLISNDYGNYTIGGGYFFKGVHCSNVKEILNKYKSN